MQLKDLGEFGLIQHLVSFFKPNLSNEIEGIGDDCAIIPFKDSSSLLVTTDLLVEDVHFLKNKIAANDLGYKSLAVNLSDIAAMGGKPLYAFLSLGLPIETTVDWIDEFAAGFKTLATETGVQLLGGDTTRSEHIIINVCLMGIMETACIKRRSQARPGDIICCTGYLGDSGAGLKILLENLPLNEMTLPLIRSHVRPKPHGEEGIWLAKHTGVHAMIDLSDGLASDIQRIMEESHCGAHLEVERLPLSPSLLQAAQAFNWPAEELALCSGEDYCLLLTVAPQDYSRLNHSYQQHFHRPLFSIGTIVSSSLLTYTYKQQAFIPKKEGFDHFKTLE